MQIQVRLDTHTHTHTHTHTYAHVDTIRPYAWYHHLLTGCSVHVEDSANFLHNACKWHDDTDRWCNLTPTLMHCMQG